MGLKIQISTIRETPVYREKNKIVFVADITGLYNRRLSVNRRGRLDGVAQTYLLRTSLLGTPEFGGMKWSENST